MRLDHTLPLLQYDDGTRRRAVPRLPQGKPPHKARLHIASTERRGVPATVFFLFFSSYWFSVLWLAQQCVNFPPPFKDRRRASFNT
ncbi:MAG: hypothetical protein GF353_15115 [Candidatus Lokiarchaeota archaeon]|nr:hypothetical protein [Candidatus Lokiarchaeota archaeon]